ncbi:response regulator transcription factor, partial [Paracoccus liaowanqingii]
MVLHDPNALRAAAFASILSPWAQQSQVELRITHDPEELADLPDLGTTACIYPIGGWSLRHPNVTRTIARLRAISPTSPLIVFADEADSAEIAAAIDGGLQGFIPTTMPANVALAAIQFIINGGTYHPHPLAGARSPAPLPVARVRTLDDHRPAAPDRP